jgi:uncharacterized protein YcbK (DUF882 family)
MAASMRSLKTICMGLVFAVGLSGCALFRPAPIEWNDTKWCVPIELKVVLNKVARKFGKLRIHSTHRWPRENKRKGGKSKSYHLKCRAVDFSVVGGATGVTEFLKSQSAVGGYSYYPHQSFYHIDNGPRRTW